MQQAEIVNVMFEICANAPVINSENVFHLLAIGTKVPKVPTVQMALPTSSSAVRAVVIYCRFNSRVC